MSTTDIKTCEVLLDEWNTRKEEIKDPQKLTFTGVVDQDIYNITAPFTIQGDVIIAGRVEPRDSEHSTVQFFVRQDELWVKKETPVFMLQDPFFTHIQGEIVIGGVEIFPHPHLDNHLSWRTVFYKGHDLESLCLFFKGPEGMKDLRLVELPTGEVGIFTRPQGEKGGRGKIGYTSVPSLADLDVTVIEDAPLLDNQFSDEEWGGANEIHVLANGLLGVLGHIACFDEQGDRHYYPMTFSFDPKTHVHSPIKLIATRSDFLSGPTKRPDLVDVVFSGGMVRNDDGTAVLYAGISDADAQRITINDPFKEIEIEN